MYFSVVLFSLLGMKQTGPVPGQTCADSICCICLAIRGRQSIPLPEFHICIVLPLDGQPLKDWQYTSFSFTSCPQLYMATHPSQYLPCLASKSLSIYWMISTGIMRRNEQMCVFCLGNGCWYVKSCWNLGFGYRIQVFWNLQHSFNRDQNQGMALISTLLNALNVPSSENKNECNSNKEVVNYQITYKFANCTILSTLIWTPIPDSACFPYLWK